jgi:hypothetical protein
MWILTFLITRLGTLETDRNREDMKVGGEGVGVERTLIVILMHRRLGVVMMVEEGEAVRRMRTEILTRRHRVEEPIEMRTLPGRRLGKATAIGMDIGITEIEIGKCS